MKPPELYTRVFGSLAARLFFGTIAAMGAWDVLIEQGDGSMLIFILVLLGATVHEAKKLDAYRAWKREWDAASGITPKTPLLAKLMRYRLFRLWVILMGWGLATQAVLMIAAKSNASDDSIAGMTVWLGIGCTIHTFMFLVRWAMSLRKRKAQVALPVSVCLPIPRQAPDFRQMFAAIPSYSRELIERSAASSSTNRNQAPR